MNFYHNVHNLFFIGSRLILSQSDHFLLVYISIKFQKWHENVRNDTLTFNDTSLDRSPIWGMLLSDKSRCCRAAQLLICSMAYHEKSITLVHAHNIKKWNSSLVPHSWFSCLLCLLLEAEEQSLARGRGRSNNRI